MVSSLPVTPAKGYEDFRPTMYEIEGHLREADAMSGEKVPDEMKNVAPMQVLFEELRLHARRQGLHNDRHSYDDLRFVLIELATIRDEEKAAKGSLRAFDDDKSAHGDAEPSTWMELSIGDWVWVDAGQFNASSRGRAGKGKAKGKANICCPYKRKG